MGLFNLYIRRINYTSIEIMFCWFANHFWCISCISFILKFLFDFFCFWKVKNLHNRVPRGYLNKGVVQRSQIQTRPLIFQTFSNFGSNSLSLKYQRFTQCGCKEMEIFKKGFVIIVHLLWACFVQPFLRRKGACNTFRQDKYMFIDVLCLSLY